jgi:pimeloyl-ACP methyl ester carboxylesterase
MRTEARVRDDFVSLNGLRYHYREWANEGAPALVLLHGVNGNSSTWDHIAPSLRERYRVLAPDLSGHGGSDWATEYTYAGWLDDLAAFATALSLRRYALLGLSLGGTLAYLYAARHPDEIERLVIVDTAPELLSAGAALIQQSFGQSDTFDTLEDALAARRPGYPFATESELRRLVSVQFMQGEDGRWRFRADPAVRAPDPRRRIGTAEQWAALASLACPTLLVRGAESYLLSRETAERVAAAVPNCRLVEVPNAAHGVPFENPAGFTQAIREFL